MILQACNALRAESRFVGTEKGMHAGHRLGPENGRDTEAAERLAPKALTAERPWEGSESHMLPEWGSVAR